MQSIDTDPGRAGSSYKLWHAARFCLTATVLSLSACGSVPERTKDSAVLNALSGLERTQSYDPYAVDIDVLHLGVDALAFLDDRMAGIRNPYDRVRALRSAVFDSDGLDFSVDETLTLTANEAFEYAGGNCVALANFFVAAARHLGLDAQFQEVDRETTREDDVFRVTERHINVSGDIPWPGGRQARYVLDYLAVPEDDFGRSAVISDQRAFAHYYNNLGVRHLLNNDIETALQYLKRALLADARVDFVWSNLAVVYARRGDTEASAFSHRQAEMLQ